MMRVSVLQDQLERAVKSVSKGVDKAAALDVLQHIHAYTGDSRLIIAGTNLGMCISATIGAKVDKPGEGTFHLETILNFAPLLSQERVDLVWYDAPAPDEGITREYTMSIRCGATNARLFGINPAGMVALPDINTLDIQPSMTYTAGLKKSLKALAQTADKKDAGRLNMIVGQFAGGKLTLNASDGNRLASETLDTPAHDDGVFSVSAALLLKAFDALETGGEIGISFDGKFLHLVSGNVYVSIVADTAAAWTPPAQWDTIGAIEFDNPQALLPALKSIASEGAWMTPVHMTGVWERDPWLDTYHDELDLISDDTRTTCAVTLTLSDSTPRALFIDQDTAAALYKVVKARKKSETAPFTIEIVRSEKNHALRVGALVLAVDTQHQINTPLAPSTLYSVEAEIKTAIKACIHAVDTIRTRRTLSSLFIWTGRGKAFRIEAQPGLTIIGNVTQEGARAVCEYTAFTSSSRTLDEWQAFIERAASEYTASDAYKAHKLQPGDPILILYSGEWIPATYKGISTSAANTAWVQTPADARPRQITFAFVRLDTDTAARARAGELASV